MFEREEMFAKSIAGEKKPPHMHVFVVQGDWESWQARLEEDKESHVGKVDVAMKSLKTNKDFKITITAAQATPGDSDGDILVFPNRLRIRTSESTESIVNAIIQDNFTHLSGVTPLESTHIFVCCHAKRDKRCGYCGPLILEAISKRQTAGVESRACSHVGGHIYAGNAIVFNRDGRSDWLGYLTDSPECVDMVVGLASGAISQPEVQHWRGRSGMSCEEHISFCASCTDIEDLVVETKAMNVLFVLGGPGSGKGTQCERIIGQFEFVHLSAGDLLRAERQNKASTHGALIESYIKAGTIVPVEITVELILDAMKKSGHSNFLIDGFPRNADNLEGWNRVVGKQAKVLGCLFFDCPEPVMESRLLERGKTSGRSDDNIESIRKRFYTYQNDTKPIIDHFTETGRCWRIVSDTTRDQVFLETRKVLIETLKFKALPPKALFVLGGPGSGKGTQCERVTSNFDFVHLSAGDLLRAERNDPLSSQGQLISSFIKKGKIVPVEITVNLLLKAALSSGRRNFLIDGFPRNADNLQGWDKVVGSGADVLGCLFFDCPESVMEARLLERGKTSGRTDDNIESIRKRFATYNQETRPIIEHYQKIQQCFKINSDRRAELIQGEVHSILANSMHMIPKRPFTSCAAVSGKTMTRKSIFLAGIPPAMKVAIGVAGVSILMFIGFKVINKK